MSIPDVIDDAVGDHPTLDDFAREARAFLDRHRALRNPDDHARRADAESVNLFPDKTDAEVHAEVENARNWRRTVFDAGFGWLDGPVEYGGRGLPVEYRRIFTALEQEYETPPLGVFGITYGMVAPMTLAYGSEEYRRRHVPAFYRGDAIGCQLFSEPGAGSDLAAVSTRAVRDGDEWTVDGQKVWTSRAHLADFGLLLARTSTHDNPHQGLTMFLFDMRSPGVEVRPLRQMTGGASFNEVFLTGVRIPDAGRLGPVDDGWSVTISTLMREREFMGTHRSLSAVDALIDLFKRSDLVHDPAARQAIAAIYENDRISTFNVMRAEAKRRSGQPPGPEMSIDKLARTANLERVCDAIGRLLGPRLIADSGEGRSYEWAGFLLAVPGVRLAGGTDEIQKNTIAERVLGLPKEPRGVA